MRKALRLRTKLLLTVTVVSASLTAVSLLVVSRAVEKRERARISQDLNNSVSAFQNAERQRQAALARTAALMADLPIVRALMTTRHTATIQDASAELWRVAATDLFVLAGQNGQIVARQARSHSLPQVRAQQLLEESVARGGENHWWAADDHLYDAAVHPIYFGSEAHNDVLGLVAVGDEIDERVARELRQVSGSDVAFRYGSSIVRSTLPAAQQRQLEQAQLSFGPGLSSATELQLGDERFLAITVRLSADPALPISLTVLKSLDQAMGFVRSLNRLLLILGLIAVLSGSALVFLISSTITLPLRNLVNGVRALGRGDYGYPLTLRSGDEVGELTTAFDQMRRRIQSAQHELLESERQATIGRMASSISHDLRHSLAAMYANAEFLADGRRSAAEREELYQEIRAAVLEMTDLIESLLEFSRTRESLHLDHGELADVLDRAVQAVRLHPQYQKLAIQAQGDVPLEGYFDARKLERVFKNLLLNACAVVPVDRGTVTISVCRDNGRLAIRVADNGHGIPDGVRDRIFEPFFSYGKDNGTGLGLNVAQKIVQDHGGELRLESTSDQGTVFLVTLPWRRSGEDFLPATVQAANDVQ